MNGRGFTIIELAVTLVVVAILLTLGVAGIFQMQANARDAERKEDIETIARGLENRYKLGNPLATSSSSTEAKIGFYPGIHEVQHMQGQSGSAYSYSPTQISEGYLAQGLPGTNQATFTNPAGNFALTLICTSSCAAPENTSQISSAFAGQDKYVYEPITAGGAVCTSGDCVRFNLYWISETDKTVYKGIAGLNILRSKHQ